MRVVVRVRPPLRADERVGCINLSDGDKTTLQLVRGELATNYKCVWGQAVWAMSEGI